MDSLQKTNGNGFPAIEVGLDDRVLGDGEAIEILRKQTGLTALPKDCVRNMAALGVYARGVGVLRKQRGEVLVSQAWLNNALEALIQQFNKEQATNKPRVSVLRTYAHEIGNLIAVKNASQYLALELEKAAAPTGKPDEAERPRNVPFSSGTVIVAKDAHIHADKNGLPPNGSGSNSLA